MDTEAALALAAKESGGLLHFRFFTSRSRRWYALATVPGAHDPDGNTIHFAECLGFLTTVTAATFARDAVRELALWLPEREQPAPTS